MCNIKFFVVDPLPVTGRRSTVICSQQSVVIGAFNFKQNGHTTVLPRQLSVSISISKQSPNKQLLVTQTTTYSTGSALLIASTLHERRQVNVRKRKRNSWARKQTLTDQVLDNRARNSVARLVKSGATPTRIVRQATLLKTCSTLLLV